MTLEDRIVFDFFSSAKGYYGNKDCLKAENAVIKEAYLGRRKQVFSLPFPVGLQISVELEAGNEKGFIEYIDMPDIEMLMRELQIDRMEYLVGKKVTAYYMGYRTDSPKKLEGLSVRGE